MADHGWAPCALQGSLGPRGALAGGRQSVRARGVRWGQIAAGVAMLFLPWTGPMARLASAQDPLFTAMAVAHRKDVREAADFALPTPEGRTENLSAVRGLGVIPDF